MVTNPKLSLTPIIVRRIEDFNMALNKTFNLPFGLITKEQFDDAYNKHLPSGWIKFAFRYFSKNTERKDFAPRRIITGILLGLFGVGFISTIIGLPRPIIAVSTIAYSILLAILVLYLFSAVILNNIRINKIRKILGVTKAEYNALVSKFY